jgi:hypothetical protein
MIMSGVSGGEMQSVDMSWCGKDIKDFFRDVIRK